jgi:MFS family permease
MNAMTTPAAAPRDLATGREAASSRSGWINVLVAAVIMLATLPGRTQGLGLITEPMLRELQLDRVTYASINLWATLVGAAVCLPIGKMFDRIGLRGATVVLTLLLAAVVWTMSAFAGGALALFALVLATRALGQSALSVASITAVAKSFERRVGMAMGVYSVLLTLLFAGAFTLVGTSVRVDGWRAAWRLVAVGLVATAPLVLLLRERKPSSDDDTELVDSFPLAHALRTPAFWVFGAATSLFGLVSSGLGLFNEAVLAERGFDQQAYVRFLAGTTVIGLCGQLACGWLTLHWPMQRLLGVAMFVHAVALVALPMLASVTQLWVFAVLIGVSGGMITVVFFSVWRLAFGPHHLGRIQGAAQMLTVVASAIGPLIFAQSASWTGSYFPALWLLSPCVLALSVAAFRVELPSSNTPMRVIGRSGQ